MHKIIATPLITFFIFSCLAMEKQTQQEIGVDFTAILPHEIQKHIISHVLNSKDIRDSLCFLYKLSRVNKSFNQIIHNFSIPQLAVFFDGNKRKVALHLKNFRKIKPAILQNYPADKTLNSKLIQAVKNNDEKTVELLLQQNADVECTDNSEHPVLILAASRGNLKIIRLLLDAGANINRADNKNGYTALIWTVLNRRHDVLSLLLKFRVKINHQDNFGNTALSHACDKNSHKIVSMLLDAGSDINLKNNNKKTAYDIAIQQGNTGIVILLRSKNSNFGQQRKKENADDFMEIPQNIQNIIIFHTLDKKTIKSCLYTLVSISCVNKSYYNLTRKNPDFSIQKLAKFFEKKPTLIAKSLKDLNMTKIDFTSQIPKELQAHIIAHAINPKGLQDIKNIKKSFVFLGTLPRVNKSFNQVIQTHSDLIIKELARHNTIASCFIARFFTKTKF